MAKKVDILGRRYKAVPESSGVAIIHQRIKRTTQRKHVANKAYL